MAPPEFLRELEKLQDQIPPFCNDEAFAVIQTELGVPVSQAFSSISPQAVAGRGRVAARVIRCFQGTQWDAGLQLRYLHLHLQQPGSCQT